jgi:hypothetical protein
LPFRYWSLGLHKGRPSYRRSLQPSKENIQHFKIWKFCTFFYFFVGHFCPPGSGSGSAIWMRIRIRIQQLKLMRIHVAPDPDMDPDPKSWSRYYIWHCKHCWIFFTNLLYICIVTPSLECHPSKWVPNLKQTYVHDHCKQIIFRLVQQLTGKAKKAYCMCTRHGLWTLWVCDQYLMSTEKKIKLLNTAYRD